MKRKILLLSALFASMILVLIIGFRIYAYFELREAAKRFEMNHMSLNPQTYAPQAVPEVENGATILQGGAYAIAMTNEERGFLRALIEKPYTTWDEKSTIRARKIVELERNQAAYQLMTQAIPLEKSSYKLHYDLGWYMPIPNYLAFMQAKFLIGARARLKLIDHDLPGALQAIAVQERLSASLLHESVMISYLIGISTLKDYNALVQEILPHAGQQTLELIQKQQHHIRMMMVSSDRLFAADAAATYNALIDKYPEGAGSQLSQDRLPRWFYFVNRRLFLAGTLNFYWHEIERSRVPLSKAKIILPQSDCSTEGIVRHALGDYVGTEVISRIQGSNTELNLAELAIKMAYLAQKEGSYPGQLTGLEPRPSVYSGEAVAYKVESDGSAVLFYPESDKYWEKIQKDHLPPKPLFKWKLPAFAGGEPAPLS